jgi:prepilin-type N-terminal cleavage/methylation domain-containing protein
VFRGEKGFNLVEVMIALVVVLLVSLAMMQTALVSIDSNMINVLRDEAVSLAEERISIDRNLALSTTDFDLNLSQEPVAVPVDRNVRNATVQYSARRTVNNYPLANPTTKEVIETVTWTWKGQNYTYSGRTLLKRP